MLLARATAGVRFNEHLEDGDGPPGAAMFASLASAKGALLGIVAAVVMDGREAGFAGTYLHGCLNSPRLTSYTVLSFSRDIFSNSLFS